MDAPDYDGVAAHPVGCGRFGVAAQKNTTCIRPVGNVCRARRRFHMCRNVRTPEERVIEDAYTTVARDGTENVRIVEVFRESVRPGLANVVDIETFRIPGIRIRTDDGDAQPAERDADPAEIPGVAQARRDVGAATLNVDPGIRKI